MNSMSKKFIKPLILIFVAMLSVSAIFFTACDPNPYYYKLDELRAPVKAVELVYYDNPNQKSFASWRGNHFKDLKPLDMSAMQTTATLDADRIDDFMQDLCEQHIHHKDYEVDAPKGRCIRIVYEDNYFDILSCNKKQYIGTYSPNGEVVEFIGGFGSYNSYEYLLQTYFDI